MRLPKYVLHRASGRATVQYRPMFGPHPHYLPGAYGSPESKSAYDEIVQAILKHKLSKPTTAPRKNGTISQMVEAYVTWAEDHYGGRQSKEFQHLWRVCQSMLAIHAKTLVLDFGPIALKQVRTRLVDLGQSRTHINHQIDRLRRVFKWGVENEWCDASVLANLKAVAGLRKGKTKARETKPVQAISWEVVQQVLPHVSPVIASMVQIHWHAGMRSDELTAMRGCEIAMGGDVWLYRPTDHKTAWRGLMKLIAIGPRAQALIRPYLSDDPAAYLFGPAIALEQRRQARAASRKTPLYGKAKTRAPKTRRTNPRYEYHAYHGAIKHGFTQLCKHAAAKLNGGEPRRQKRPEGLTLRAWMDQLGLVYWHPHQLRHSRGTITRETHGLEGSASILGNTLDAAQLYAEQAVGLAARIARVSG